ncbi:phosphoglycerate mutase-like protein isoform X1 [Vicia villosa]|uniref:phosphoglycerate mutase-like protein isoform X1 n=3 Tax=Vicia villosa TaxID=3911 RepID=UPI00273AFFEA|nr:phosphoglycerate mutase-like protein isoform X1 [Vicia villosa]
MFFYLSNLFNFINQIYFIFHFVCVTAVMDTAAGPSLYPLHHSKTIHLVRHAQGVHNVEGEKDHDAYLSYDYFDANLTPLGWKQVENLQKHVKANELPRKIELVVVSPLLRTMQTAVGVFGGEAYPDGISEPPLMVENVGHSDHHAVSSLNCPPFLAVELCREQMGLHPCDKRRTVSEYRHMFPGIDFSLIETDEDTWWKPEREKKEEVTGRGLKFLEWLCTRKEKEIAVVTHSSFLFNTLSAFGNDCHPNIKTEMCKHFANCELRSMVIVDKGMIGSTNNSTTNYPGKIPHGLDLPSDATD